MPDYFRSSINRATDKTASQVLMQNMLIKSSNVFFSSGIECFEGTFSLKVKEPIQPHQASPRKVAYALQEPFKEELHRLQKQWIIVPLGVDETLEWCNSFVIVLKANNKLWLCLDPARLNKTLIRSVHRVLTFNDFLPRLAGVEYFTLTDASTGYHNLKSDDKSLYILLSTWQL